MRAVPALRYDRFGPNARCAVWESTEEAEELAQALPPAWRRVAPAHPNRQRETLGARRALLSLEPELAARAIEKDAYGKPYLAGEPPRHFSLSHSHGHAAALLAGTSCGVDLQRRDEKIVRLRSKFERPDERAFVEAQPSEVDALHVLWGAKESLYKLWGRRGLHWTRDMSVSAFALRPGGGDFTGRVSRNGITVHAELVWRWEGDFCLVAAWATDV